MSSFHIPIPSGGFTLKEVRRITWEVRSEWRNLGSQLGVDAGTLDVSGSYVSVCRVFSVLVAVKSIPIADSCLHMVKSVGDYMYIDH